MKWLKQNGHFLVGTNVGKEPSLYLVPPGGTPPEAGTPAPTAVYW